MQLRLRLVYLLLLFTAAIQGLKKSKKLHREKFEPLKSSTSKQTFSTANHINQNALLHTNYPNNWRTQKEKSQATQQLVKALHQQIRHGGGTTEELKKILKQLIEAEKRGKSSTKLPTNRKVLAQMMPQMRAGFPVMRPMMQGSAPSFQSSSMMSHVQEFPGVIPEVLQQQLAQQQQMLNPMQSTIQQNTVKNSLVQPYQGMFHSNQNTGGSLQQILLQKKLDELMAGSNMQLAMSQNGNNLQSGVNAGTNWQAMLQNGASSGFYQDTLNERNNVGITFPNGGNWAGMIRNPQSALAGYGTQGFLRNQAGALPTGAESAGLDEETNEVPNKQQKNSAGNQEGMLPIGAHPELKYGEAGTQNGAQSTGPDQNFQKKKKKTAGLCPCQEKKQKSKTNDLQEFYKEVGNGGVLKYPSDFEVRRTKSGKQGWGFKGGALRSMLKKKRHEKLHKKIFGGKKKPAGMISGRVRQKGKKIKKRKSKKSKIESEEEEESGEAIRRATNRRKESSDGKSHSSEESTEKSSKSKAEEAIKKLSKNGKKKIGPHEKKEIKTFFKKWEVETKDNSALGDLSDLKPGEKVLLKIQGKEERVMFGGKKFRQMFEKFMERKKKKSEKESKKSSKEENGITIKKLTGKKNSTLKKSNSKKSKKQNSAKNSKKTHSSHKKLKNFSGKKSSGKTTSTSKKSEDGIKIDKLIGKKSDTAKSSDDEGMTISKLSGKKIKNEKKKNSSRKKSAHELKKSSKKKSSGKIKLNKSSGKKSSGINKTKGKSSDQDTMTISKLGKTQKEAKKKASKNSRKKNEVKIKGVAASEGMNIGKGHLKGKSSKKGKEEGKKLKHRGRKGQSINEESSDDEEGLKMKRTKRGKKSVSLKELLDKDDDGGLKIGRIRRKKKGRKEEMSAAKVGKSRIRGKKNRGLKIEDLSGLEENSDELSVLRVKRPKKGKNKQKYRNVIVVKSGKGKHKRKSRPGKIRIVEDGSDVDTGEEMTISPQKLLKIKAKLKIKKKIMADNDSGESTEMIDMGEPMGGQMMKGGGMSIGSMMHKGGMGSNGGYWGKVRGGMKQGGNFWHNLLKAKAMALKKGFSAYHRGGMGRHKHHHNWHGGLKRGFHRGIHKALRHGLHHGMKHGMHRKRGRVFRSWG